MRPHRIQQSQITTPTGSILSAYDREDNLSARDNWPVPNLSFVRRFYCICRETARKYNHVGHALLLHAFCHMHAGVTPFKGACSVVTISTV